MIAEWGLQLGMTIFDILYMLIDSLPNFPPNVINTIDYIFELMFSAVNLAGVFLDLGMVKTLIPIVIAVLNFDKMVKLIIFAIKKIPFLGME